MIDDLAPQGPRPCRAESVTSTVFGATKRPLPHDAVPPRWPLYLPRCISIRPSTILRLRSRTAAMSIFQLRLGDAELLAAAEVGGDLRAVDHVFAGQAGDVRAGAAKVLPLDYRRPLPLGGQRPRQEFAGLAAAQHDDVIFFWFGRHLSTPYLRRPAA